MVRKNTTKDKVRIFKTRARRAGRKAIATGSTVKRDLEEQGISDPGVGEVMRLIGEGNSEELYRIWDDIKAKLLQISADS